VRLDAMMFAEFFARAGGVEVTEGDEFQLVKLLIPDQDLLEHQLRFAVGIDWALRQILGHRHAVGRAVGRAGGTEDELLHAAFNGGVGEFERVDDVVVEILFRIRHGFAHERARCEMHNGIGPGRFDGVEDVAFLLGFAQNKFRAGIHRRAMAFGEIVINRDRMAGTKQFFRANGANVTRAAGDKDVHALTMKGACRSAKFKMAEINLRAPGKRADGFDTGDQPSPVNLLQREFHLLHERVVFAGNVRFDGEIRHGGLLVRRNGYVYVGEFDLHTAGPRTGHQGHLGDFFTIHGIALAKFG
jgi:hypothetical protein